MPTSRQQSPPTSPPPDPKDPRSALETLARRYYRPLVAFFRKRAKNSADVQDLVQQVFLRLSQHSPPELHNSEGYLFQTAANTLKDHYRNAAVRERFSREHTPTDRSDFSPERVLLGRERLDLLVDTLRQLPERTRDIFMLRCFEGLKSPEVARLQGISVRAVEKHMNKALVHIGQALGPEEEG
jgi:RNA polymerase sigma factor (sigma-70 family)